MNKLKNVVRAISPFARGKRSSEYDVEQAGNNLYNESMWQNRVENLNIKLFMELFYRRYNAEKVHTIDFILEQFAGRENDMLLMLTDKYNVSRGDVYGLMDRAQKAPGKTGEPSTASRGPPPPPPPRGAQAAAPPPPGPANNSRAEAPARVEAGPSIADMSPPDIRRALELFYKRYSPQKLHTIDSVLNQYAGNEDEMLQSLKEKYEASDEEVLDILRHARQLPDQEKSNGSHSAGEKNTESPRGSVSSFVNGLSSMQQPPGKTTLESRQGAPVRQVPKQMSHREVNQSLRGVIFEVRNNSKPAPQPSSTVSRTSLPGKQSSFSQAQSPKRSTHSDNQSRLRAILDKESEGSQPVQPVPFEAESSSGGEESESEAGTEEGSILKDPEYKYDYSDVPTAQQVQKRSIRKPLVGRSPGITNSHPHLNGEGHHSIGQEKMSESRDAQHGKGNGVEADTEGIAAQLEQAKAAFANSKNDKTDMLKLLEMMASNPRDLNGAISEFIKTYETKESAGQRSPEKANLSVASDGPFVLGHHSRFNRVETPKSPSSVGEHSRGRSRERSNYNSDHNLENSTGHNRVLNLSDLHGHHRSLEQDIASLATNRTGRASAPTESRDRNSSAPHMRPTKASIRRETDTAKDAKSSGRFVPFHDGSSPVVQITRARSPAPGVSRSNWTGATPSEEDLQKLTKRSTSSTALYRGRGGTGLGYDSSAAWGERPRTSRAPSPSGYDVRGRSTRAASPTPSVRSIDSFGSNGSLNARNVANRYSSPSPSVRSNYSARSGSQSSRIPGREPVSSKRSASPGPSGGGRIYFKESNTNGQQYTGNTNNTSVEGKEKERSALLEEQYKLAKKYLDHGLEQARVSQKMAELNLKASSRRVSGHAADAIASVEHDAGVDDWVECFDPRTKRNYYHSKSRMKSVWSRPEQAVFNWPHNPKSNTKKADAESVASKQSLASTPSKRADTAKSVKTERSKETDDSHQQLEGSTSKHSKPEWRMVKDEKTGRNYWYNRHTRETTWYDPYKGKAVP